MDFGPLVPVYDAVCAGREVFRPVECRASAHRPVTPPGRIFATEAFACEVTLLPPGTGLACDYAGRIPTAKAFGSLAAIRASARRRRGMRWHERHEAGRGAGRITLFETLPPEALARLAEAPAA